MKALRVAGVAFLALGLRPAGIAADARPLDACRLLTDREIRAVHDARVADKKSSEQSSGTFRVVQCFYRTTDFVRSVNLAVAVPAGPTRSGPREYWRDTLRGAAPAGGAGPPAGERNPPKAVAGLGEEAFWVGDRLTGALYVLQGEAFLRISVGGAIDEATRLQRSKALALKALRRLGTHSESRDVM